MSARLPTATPRESGFGLVLVLVIITAISLFLYTEITRRTAEANDRQMQFSIAQTNNILNMVYAYYKKNNEWPAQYGGCQSPSDFMHWDQSSANGWGFPIEGGSGCTQNAHYYSRFVITQDVPEQFVEDFVSYFSEHYSVSNRSVENGTQRVEIELDRTAGALKNIVVDRLSSEYTYPLTVELPVCQDKNGVQQAPFVLEGLEAMCVDDGATGNHNQNNNPPNVYAGFRTRIVDGTQIFYDAYINQYLLSEDGSAQSISITADGDRINANDRDGLSNADSNCPTNSYSSRIQVAVLTWCP